MNVDFIVLAVAKIMELSSRPGLKEELKNPESIRLYNVLNGLMRLRNVDIYVTCSNSKMLTKDVLTVFRGRGDEIRVCPIEFQATGRNTHYGKYHI